MLPVELLSTLQTIAEIFVTGQGVTVMPTEQMLTTQEAADLLNISRQYLVNLLEKGYLPFQKGRYPSKIAITERAGIQGETS